MSESRVGDTIQDIFRQVVTPGLFLQRLHRTSIAFSKLWKQPWPTAVNSCFWPQHGYSAISIGQDLGYIVRSQRSILLMNQQLNHACE